jgi:tetratricopeptide (TPR) repeat protein
MFAAGVTCSDCHDPHRLDPLAGGDALCARCHSPERFAVEAHHHHPEGSAGARCVECHMPQRTYMVVDPRRDHSLRVPRPDVAAAIGAPDACTGCHRERDATWAGRAHAAWYPGSPRAPHWGEAVYAAWQGEAGAEAGLIELADDPARPPIVRATAISLLADVEVPAAARVLERATADAEGLVRLGALIALDRAGLEARLALVVPLLRDPLLAIRMEAARLIAPLPADRLSASDLAARDAAIAEVGAAELHDADRPEAHHNLGNLALAQGDTATAEREFGAAVRIDPTFSPARVNLADVYRLEGREDDAVAVLRAGLGGGSGAGGRSGTGVEPASDAPLRHALGLALVRLGRTEEALIELERAAAAAPEAARYAYVLGVALQSTGKLAEATEVLARAHRRRGSDADILIALIGVEREAGRRADALLHARALVALRPDDAGARALLAELEGSRP